MAAKTFGALTTGLQTVTATGAVTPTAGLDISGITQDFTLWIQVQSLTAGKKATITLEDSVNGFTASVPVWSETFTGAVASANDVKVSKRKYEKPALRAGTGSAVARLNITQIDSATTLIVQSWIEYN